MRERGRGFACRRAKSVAAVVARARRWEGCRGQREVNNGGAIRAGDLEEVAIMVCWSAMTAERVLAMVTVTVLRV